MAIDNSYRSIHEPMKANDAWEASRADPRLLEPDSKRNGASTGKILKYNSYRSIHEPMEATEAWEAREASKSDAPLSSSPIVREMVLLLGKY